MIEDVEQRALSSFGAPPRFWKRYVDDTCTAIPPSRLPSFHQHLNSIEPSIRFTVETEKEGKLPFLDTEISHHPDGSLTTTLYRKKTHTDKYLDFASHHPLAHKIAVTRTLFGRARSLCSNADDLHREETHVVKALKMNGYPQAVIDGRRPHGQRPTPESEPPKASVVLPYIRGLSESIRRILTPLQIRTCFKPHRTLRNILVHPKDPVPPDQKKGVVYRVPCGDCDQTYVGQTARTLHIRRREHMRALTNADPSSSALAEHAMAQRHSIAWGEAEVLDSNSLLHQRCAIEAWHIRSQANPMNRETGLLPPAYNPLIHSTHQP